MTPSEKAKELIEKFTKLDIEIGGEHDGYITMKKHDAKECALIAVQEIIADNPNIYDSDRLNFNYWSNVKRELQLL
jgi:hypothetical protein